MNKWVEALKGKMDSGKMVKGVTWSCPLCVYGGVSLAILKTVLFGRPEYE